MRSLRERATGQIECLTPGDSFLSSFVSVFLYYPHKKKYMGAGPSGEWAAHLAAGVPASQSFSSPLVLHSSGSSCALCHLCTIFS